MYGWAEGAELDVSRGSLGDGVSTCHLQLSSLMVSPVSLLKGGLLLGTFKTGNV